MNYALNLEDDGRVLSATYPQYAPDEAVTVDELPEGDVSQYRYVDGEFLHDPLPEPEADPKPSLEERVGDLETDTADLAEALDLLLSGVTE